ncbi:MAG: DUF1499 domain-containing protein [Gemmatimonadaceae bacterium]
MPQPDSSLKAPRLIVAGATAAVLALIALAMAGLGYRAEWWGLSAAFRLFMIGGGLGAIAFFLSLASLVTKRRSSARMVVSILALVVGAAVAGTFARWLITARTVPPIHDITTDTDDPPQFIAILPLRAHAKNSAIYGGPSVAAKQRTGYPDVQPIVLNTSAVEAFNRALVVSHSMGWKIVAADSTTGRIEATATTRWFGFKDDIVVRVRPMGSAGSRVDVRSESRIGGSDVGTNAARIRMFSRLMTVPR